MNPWLRIRLDAYLELRRALGYPTRAQERLLGDFLVFIEPWEWQGFETARLAVEWLRSSSGGLSRSAQAGRLSMVRGFLSYLRAFRPDTTVPPFGLLPGRARPRRPRLLTALQIRNVLEAALTLGPKGSLRPRTYYTFIGLLAACGLRGGEAVRLDRADVLLELEPPRLLVRRTKFRKSRLVPVHPTTAEALRVYAGERDRLGYGPREEAFFLSEKGTRLTHGVAGRTFVSLLRRLGIRAPTGKGPSLHGLRHAFAVERLRTWYREGADTRARLADLSVYMGHARIDGTYWYLTATPELLGSAAARFEAFAGGSTGGGGT